ncbi:hypothetical protein [Tuwongella immobilis]|uniref:Uncharacterized protein n=1 Tax=Tuwongella immobilis TaxID=692036 RepID=A0A6C2YLE5_9BACT|nr:hypothetical protein [Tuwongella immobilis]VIP02059.1 Uncharacterized protein OS=Planctomyces brasiliensis (strain ATCC 49424 / DSM 5305 / JCM 21570 / NBRC 103401 / IFAM 1448) GN=Plabr_4597 PE=4 SV=1 [Tuwongella immobilis]VTS00264.1 Uncharacterized protein OS=Planctomyces brasiliensis (strain ATCC 49424 / DSM 5305 / JCM 21570 / NBRC 103401 / IFAM 1448) GN=Plabr_4597 PE=4 SV=1 [Tuwongella immobilis]
MQPMFDEWIADCAQRFGPAPRRISLWDRYSFWWLKRPEWLYHHPDDLLETLFLNFRSLIRNGRVTWGHIVQANNTLFFPGTNDAPAEVIFADGPPGAVDVDDLARVCAEVGSFKHTESDDPALAAIGKHLAAETDRTFDLPIPASIAHDTVYRLSTIYVFRKHLPQPQPRLAQGLLPLIVHPQPPYWTIPLPARYWPQPMLDWWQKPKTKNRWYRPES